MTAHVLHDPSAAHAYRLTESAKVVETDVTHLVAWLDAFLSRRGADLPRMPSAALEIIALSRKPNTRLEEITALIEREPALAAKVLKLANSLLYGGVEPVSSLKGALVRLGLDAVRDLVVEAAMHLTVIRTPGYTEVAEGVRRHSSAVAWVSRFLARLTPMEAESAFLIGLLHDLGITVGLAGLSEYHREIGAAPVLTPTTWRAIEQAHQAIGERLLSVWKLPSSLTYVVGRHHELRIEGRVHPSIAVLSLAELIAGELGWGITAEVHMPDGEKVQVQTRDHFANDDVEQALRALHLTERHLEAVREDAKRLLATLDAVMRAAAK